MTCTCGDSRGPFHGADDTVSSTATPVADELRRRLESEPTTLPQIAAALRSLLSLMEAELARLEAARRKL